MALKSLDEIYSPSLYALVFLFKVTWAAVERVWSASRRERLAELLLLVAAPSSLCPPYGCKATTSRCQLIASELDN